MAMSFDDRFGECVASLFNEDRPDCPRDDVNLYADFLELLVIFSRGDGVSEGEIQDRFYGEQDKIDEREDKDERNNAELTDVKESFIKGIFSLIEERVSQYAELYPFELTENQIIFLKEDLTEPQKLYLFLLISSSLNYFKAFNSVITKDFEIVAFETIKALLPTFEVRHFGKLSAYTGTAKQKIQQLAVDIGLPVDEDELNSIGERNNQERGLDVVSWLPFEDKCYNKVVFLCQCACGKQYESKQHDIRRFENYYRFYKAKPQMTLFIPYSLINPKKNKFYHSDYIEDDYLIFERLRILFLSRKNDSVYKQLSSKELVERCIQYYRA